LVSLVEVGFWITSVGRFDFGRSTLQFEQRQSWFRDLGVSYHVGQFGFSLWLVGLASIAGAAAIAYAWWVGRERARAYFGLMLFLTGAVVGVFTAQDLLVFYAFFEAMLIPLYILIGVWGGAGRLGATLKFVIYTMAGSLLMLASVIAYGLTQGSFALVGAGVRPPQSLWIFLGFAAGFAVKAPLFPLHGWLPDAYREAPPEVAAILSGAIERHAATGELSRLGGMAKGRPALATVLMATGIIALAVPGSSAFAGEFLILTGIFVVGWGWAVVGAVAIVLAAMYMLRLISAVLHH